jgi:hypothetical protein
MVIGNLTEKPEEILNSQERELFKLGIDRSGSSDTRVRSTVPLGRGKSMVSAVNVRSRTGG